MKMRLMGAKGPAQVQPLKEERATEVGAELIGEAFIFSVAAVFVLYEYNKSVKKEERKEQARKKDLEDMKALLVRLDADMTSVKKTLYPTEYPTEKNPPKKTEGPPKTVSETKQSEAKSTDVKHKQEAKVVAER